MSDLLYPLWIWTILGGSFLWSASVPNPFVCVLAAQSCPTLCDPADCSLPGFSVHGILQARILGWIAIPFSRGTSQPRNRTLVSCITGRFFTVWATGTSLCQTHNSQEKPYNCPHFHPLTLAQVGICICSTKSINSLFSNPWEFKKTSS